MTIAHGKCWACGLLLSWAAVATSCTSDRADSAGDAGGASGSAGGAGGEPAPEGGAASLGGAPHGLLGARCKRSVECGSEELTCLSSSEELAPEVGSAAGGLCTAPCADDSSCAALGPGAFCLFFSDEQELGHCMQGCELGGPPEHRKCHGRSDFACQPLPVAPPEERCTEDADCAQAERCIDQRCSVVGCLPQCTRHDQCSAEAFCDPLWGVCVSSPPSSTFANDCAIDDPNGTGCAAGATCLAVLSAQRVRVAAFCSEPCVLGYSCANGEGSCVLQDHDFDSATGDIAYCAQGCDCSADCRTTGLACVPIESGAERRGACLYPYDEQGQQVETLDECPAGPAAASR